MKIIFGYLLIIVFSLTGINACSSCKTNNDSTEVNVEIKEMNIWLNLMPGGPPSFHFSGTLNLINNFGEDLNDIALQEVKIKSKDKILYQITPEGETQNITLKKGADKVIKFYSPQNIKVQNDLKTLDSVKVFFVFNFNGNTKTVNAGNFPLERAY